MNEGTFPNYINLATYQTIQKRKWKNVMEWNEKLPFQRLTILDSSLIRLRRSIFTILRFALRVSEATLQCSSLFNAIKFNQHNFRLIKNIYQILHIIYSKRNHKIFEGNYFHHLFQQRFITLTTSFNTDKLRKIDIYP